MTSSKSFHSKIGSITGIMIIALILGVAVYMLIIEQFGTGSTLIGTAITFYYAVFKSRTKTIEDTELDV